MSQRTTQRPSGTEGAPAESVVVVAVGQWAPGPDKAANRVEVDHQAAEAAGRGAAVLVLPENVLYTNREERFEPCDVAEPLDGPFGTAVRQAAADHGLTIVAGMTEQVQPGERPFNTVIAAGANGEILGRYRKTHLYDAFAYRESDQIAQAPPEAITIPIGGLRFGLMTCYDVRFPEFARYLVEAGADVLVVPAAWAVGPNKSLHWRTLLAARAIENVSYVVASGQTAPHCQGESQIISPAGVLLAELDDAPGLATASLSTAEVAAARRQNPSLDNRRFSVAPRTSA